MIFFPRGLHRLSARPAWWRARRPGDGGRGMTRHRRRHGATSCSKRAGCRSTSAGSKAVDQVDVAGPPRRHHLDHRAERRGQEHVLQSRHRRDPADRRPGAPRRPRHHGNADAQADRAGPVALVPDHQPVSRSRPCSRTCGSPPRCWSRGRRSLLPVVRRQAGGGEGGEPDRAVRPRREGDRAGGAPQPRRAAAARDRGGARLRAAHPDPRRADAGHVAHRHRGGEPHGRAISAAT